MEFSNKAVIEKFDPTEAQLREIVSETNALSVSDLKDKAQLKVVRESRIKLKNARVAIQKKGKEMRDDANKYSKAVIEREKELIAIIEPEERRLELIEEEAEKLAILEDRRTNLPSRITRLESIGDGLENDEEYILTLDSNQFDAYFNQRFAAKLQKDKEESERVAAEAERARREEQERKDAEIAERQRVLDEQENANRREAERLENERIAREREEKARQEEREKAERAAKEKEERERKEREDAERKKEEEREKLERAKKYKKFRSDLGWTEETKEDFKEESDGNTVTLWKKIGTFNIK